MVKTRISGHAKIVRDSARTAIRDIFGKRLFLRRLTNTIDDYGQLSASSAADTDFIGDLQYGINLDERLLKSGFVETGDAVLYIDQQALAVQPVEQDIVVEGESTVAGTYTAWEIVTQLEVGQLGGDTAFLSFRCKRRDDITIS